MEEMFMDVVMNLLYDIRLRIEGAVELYESDVTVLHRLAVQNDMPIAAGAFDTVGSALFSLRKDIRELHEACIKESIRQARV